MGYQECFPLILLSTATQIHKYIITYSLQFHYKRLCISYHVTGHARILESIRYFVINGFSKDINIYATLSTRSKDGTGYGIWICECIIHEAFQEDNGPCFNIDIDKYEYIISV